MRFTSLVRLTGSTGWKFQLLFQRPFSNLKLLNWFVIDHKVLTGLVSFRFNSLADSSGPSGSAAGAPAVAGAPEVCATSLVGGVLAPRSPWPRVPSSPPTSRWEGSAPGDSRGAANPVTESSAAHA